MVCSNCVREIPDGSEFCPRCGVAQKAANTGMEPITENPAANLLEIPGRAWEAPAPEPDRGARGWEQSGKFAAEVEREERLPAFTVFSAKGRLNRLKYAYYLLIESLAYSLLYLGLLLSLLSASPISMLFRFACLPIALLITVITIITAVKRFHDMDEPGLHVLFMVVPFYNIYISFKLLLKGSAEGFSSYGNTASKHWYWQAPLAVLLLPAVYFAVGLVTSGDAGLSAVLGRDSGNQYYYNERYDVRITFPERWTRVEVDGCVAAAQNWNASAIVTLSVDPTDLDSFEGYSNEEFDKFIEAFGEPSRLSELFEVNAGEISDLSCSAKDINGRRFVHIGFRQKDGSDVFRHIYVFGVHEGNAVTVQLILPYAAVGNELDVMMDSADSLVIDKAKEEETN